MNQRLDQALVEQRLTSTRSQAESYIKLGLVTVDDIIIDKPAHSVSDKNKISLNLEQQYVSRAGLKLASVVADLNIDFKDKVVLDVGSSTGGFTDYALKHLAEKVIAVDVGKEQLHPTLRANKKIELHEQTDIRDILSLSSPVDIVVIDVSFISLRAILPKIFELSDRDTQIIAMLKPQFEAGSDTKHKGVIKNDKIRRQILLDFEIWLKQKHFLIINQSDSRVHGAKGNKERFYLLKKEQLTS
jgi:23S rRNA (cytidine1920-2'-O)/16S rRNA (cytidine1409-2'-O)-methyltransferase